ncbi:MAG: enoyl-CoA hydratase/isomerase family protein [Solirubrobacterales bacterium]
MAAEDGREAAGHPDQTGTGKLRLDFPREAVARLTISNPANRNALDHEILDAIANTVPALDDGLETRCLLITGEDPVFSAGYDIGSIPDETFASDAEALVAHPFHAALEAIAAFPWPTVAAINGHCLGGGLELAVTCDLRIAARGAKMGMPPARLGLVYSHTGIAKFLEVVGPARTRELFLTGENFPSERAEEFGLVNRVTDPGSLEDEALSLAETVAANAPLSMRGNKRIIEALMAGTGPSPELERELVEMREACFDSEDFREGIAAFAEKRKPRWKGR